MGAAKVAMRHYMDALAVVAPSDSGIPEELYARFERGGSSFGR